MTQLKISSNEPDFIQSSNALYVNVKIFAEFFPG